MKLAIVILNWNGQKMLHQYLPTVLQYSRDEATVFVADNASTDDSLSLLSTAFPECKVIRLEKNWGFAEGYNKALQQIDAEYYLLLNSDIEVTHHWLTPSCSPFSTRTALNMQGRVGDTSTASAIPSAGDAFLTPLRTITVSTIMPPRYFGLQVQP